MSWPGSNRSRRIAQQSSSKMRLQRAARTRVRGRHGFRNAHKSVMSVSIGRPTSSAAVASRSASGSYRSSAKPLGSP
eukprot:7359943-Alexandrium_andersonii.AAC.1